MKKKRQLIKLKIHEKRLSASLCDKFLWKTFVDLAVERLMHVGFLGIFCKFYQFFNGFLCLLKFSCHGL
jgi:hypothetical protein